MKSQQFNIPNVFDLFPLRFGMNQWIVDSPCYFNLSFLSMVSLAVFFLLRVRQSRTTTQVYTTKERKNKPTNKGRRRRIYFKSVTLILLLISLLLFILIEKGSASILYFAFSFSFFYLPDIRCLTDARQTNADDTNGANQWWQAKLIHLKCIHEQNDDNEVKKKKKKEKNDETVRKKLIQKKKNRRKEKHFSDDIWHCSLWNEERDVQNMSEFLDT